MTDYLLLTFKDAFYYILTSKSLEVDSVPEFLGMFFIANVSFHLGVLYSSFISSLLTLFRSKKELNKGAYKVISVIGFLICSIALISFGNVHFGYLLGIVVAPLIFDYNIYFRQEWVIKILGFIGIAIGFIFGLIICALLSPGSHTFFYQLHAGIGAYLGWLLIYYPILYISKIFKSHNDKKLKIEHKKRALEAQVRRDLEYEQTRKDQAALKQKRQAEQPAIEKENPQKLGERRQVEIERKIQVERAMSEEGPIWGAQQQHRERENLQRKEENTRLEDEKQLKHEKEKQAESVQKKQEAFKKIENENKLKTDKEEALKRRKLAEESELERIRSQNLKQKQLDEEAKKRRDELKKLEEIKSNELVIKELAGQAENAKKCPELKNNWQDFQGILKSKNITKFYHFTDRKNLESIKKNGGLYSWWKAEELGIEIPMPGGIGFGRNIDRTYGLQNYVRLCFTKKHPMLFVAKNDSRITDPVILEVKLDVAYLRNTRFANMNATKTGFQEGPNLADLNRIRFDVVTRQDQFSVAEELRHYYQAEVMVLEKIPIDYIINIDSI